MKIVCKTCGIETSPMRTATLCWTCSTLRDQFAAAALAGILAQAVTRDSKNCPLIDYETAAEDAFLYAEYMLNERTRRDGQEPD